MCKYIAPIGNTFVIENIQPMENNQFKTAVLDKIFRKNGFDLPEINDGDNLKKSTENKTVNINTENNFDILGEYNSSNKTITMFTNMIEDYAKKLKVKNKIIYNIVYTHEVGHLYSQIAMDIWDNNSTWDKVNFQNASTEIKEGLAQLFTYWEFEDKPEYLSIFNKMVKKQPYVYKVYKEAIGINKNDLLETLRLFRKHSNHDILQKCFSDAIKDINLLPHLKPQDDKRGEASIKDTGLFD